MVFVVALAWYDVAEYILALGIPDDDTFDQLALLSILL
jgi:hypothetical protein